MSTLDGLAQVRQGEGMPKAPDTPCTVCGKLIWSGTGSLPPERRVCRACRRSRPGYKSHAAGKNWRELTCPCGAVFSTHVGGKIWCTPECRGTFRPRSMWPSVNKTRAQRHGRFGSGYARLRRQVIAEESYCWLCGYDVDKARRSPDRWSASLDHVVPVSMGGAVLERNNCRLAHLGCNRARSNR